MITVSTHYEGVKFKKAVHFNAVNYYRDPGSLTWLSLQQ
jgi:hypothetical protein